MSENTDDDGDRDIARLLRAAGPREDLPEDLAQRWEVHFRAELAAARPRRRRRGWLALGGLAAGLLAVLIWGRFNVAPTASIAIAVQSVAGQTELLLEGRRPLQRGESLPAGAVLVSGAESAIAVDWAGYDLRIRENSRVALGSDRLELRAGEIFISDQDRRPALPHALVATPFGTVRDVGTQFKVRLDGDSVVASVRSGSILADSGAVTRRADAVPGAGATLLLHSDRRVEVGKDVSDWRWIYTMAQPFELEGSTVMDFLRWSTAESGHTLRFADDGVALAASSTRLSGAMDLAGVGPERAVELVLSTTRFRARSEDGVLLVSRGSE